jgi:putative membrane protein
MKNFLKGIVVGMGGITPGLSGSVLLVIFGLYQKTINAIGTIFKDFINNLKFLIPIALGMGTGILMFSKIVDFLLANYEMPTRFLFFGLVIGTLPLFYREVKKEGFSKKYYIHVSVAALIGTLLFTVNSSAFPQVTDPNLLQSVFLGIAVAGSSIVPGVDSAVILSTLGLYELYVSSVASLDFAVLIPAGIGLGIGVLGISFVMNWLIKKYYTATFSIIFGLFIAIIPNVLNESCVFAPNSTMAISLALTLLGFAISYYLGDIQGNNEKIKKLLSH